MKKGYNKQILSKDYMKKCSPLHDLHNKNLLSIGHTEQLPYQTLTQRVFGRSSPAATFHGPLIDESTRQMQQGCNRSTVQHIHLFISVYFKYPFLLEVCLYSRLEVKHEWNNILQSRSSKKPQTYQFALPAAEHLL